MNNIALPIFIVLLSVSGTFKVFGQDNYISGYVVLNSGDTIRGEIKYQFSNEIHKRIYFRNQQTEVIYTPDEVYAFKFDNSLHYISSRALPNNTNSVNKFFRYLIKGRSSVLYDMSQNDFAFTTDSTSNILSADQEGAKKVLTFWGLYRYYFQGCPDLELKPKLKEYQVKELTDKVYMCWGEEYESFTPIKHTISTTITPVAGVSLYSSNFLTNEDIIPQFTYIDGQTLFSDPTWTFGLRLSFSKPTFNDRNAFYIEPRYSKLSFDNDFEFENSIHQVQMKYDVLTLPVVFCRNFHQNLFFGVGLNNIFRFNSSAYGISEEYEPSNGEVIVEEGVPFEQTSYFIGGLLAFGNGFKLGSQTLAAEIRFDFTVFFQEQERLWSSYRNFHFLISYPLARIYRSPIN